MPNSVVTVTFGRTAVELEAVLPWAELAYALPADLARPPARTTAAMKARLAAYASAHIHVAGRDGRPWSARVTAVDILKSPDHADLQVRFEARPPPGAGTDTFVLRDDAVAHVVMSHVIFVFVREPGHGEPRLAGVLQNPTFTLAVERGAEPPAQGFLAAFRLGARHIAEGVDHLLFLFTLMLPAPLAAEAGRWRGRRSWREAVKRLAAIVTAFTVGHSLTLILGAVLRLDIPEKPVEVLIAASILVAALEAWRPLAFAKAGPLIAGGFGLVHGMAFSSAVGAHLDSAWETAKAIAGFNLGIEAVQLAIALVAAPILIRLAATRAYTPLRLAGAAVAGCAALVWMTTRMLA
jgi:hypothetical protein